MNIPISVIVLFHNNEYFRQCINSIIVQLKNNDEIIIVNDNSDSKYYPLLEEMAHFPNVQVIDAYEVKGNRSYNRNLGVKFSKNPILAFVDGDIYFPENLFDSMRKQLNTQAYCAIYGNTYGHSGSIFSINTILGINYFDYLFNPKKWNDLKKYAILQDSREKKQIELLNGEFSWNYFYTSYCMVKRDAFFKAGQFDEEFSDWGAEDVDLGYRLTQRGQIFYDRKLIAFHIPHEKNRHKNQITNRRNMYYMLNKYKTSIFEIKIVYKKSQRLFLSLDAFYHTMRKIDVEPLNITPAYNCIYCNIVSYQNTEGDIFYINSEGNQEHLKLLGLALPFPDKYFKKAYLPYSIFIYPYPLASRIIQEFIRISGDVYIQNIFSSYRVEWDSECIKAFSASSPFANIYYVCKNFDDFNFKILDNKGYICVTPAFKYYKDTYL